MFRILEETSYVQASSRQSFLSKAKSILIKEQSNVEHLLAEIKRHTKNGKHSLASFLGANVSAADSEMLAFQIWRNLEQGFLLISLIGLRVLVENYINVHYLYHHPERLQNSNWAEQLCEDYLNRTENTRTVKSRLGNVSLYKRAKSVGLEKFYGVVYSELCDYSHFLADAMDVVHPMYFKAKTIQTAIYLITCYQDILIAIASFLDCPFDCLRRRDLGVQKRRGTNHSVY